jgi:hypothetical protein
MRKVTLIDTLQGGLDCRYLTTHLTQRKFSVISITTIATPHRGSSFADHFMSLASQHLPSVLALLELLPNGGGDGKAFECLTLESMRRFNEGTPDVEGVRYFSWGACYEPGLIDTWKWPHSVILEKEGPNDGLVSVESAKWVSAQDAFFEYTLLNTHTGHISRYPFSREPSRPCGMDERCAIYVGLNLGEGDSVQACFILPWCCGLTGWSRGE